MAKDKKIIPYDRIPKPVTKRSMEEIMEERERIREAIQRRMERIWKKRG